jgi:chorismate mutase
MDVQREQIIAMLLRPESIELGWRRSAIAGLACNTGEMVLSQPYADFSIRTDEAHRLRVRISDAVLVPACGGMSNDSPFRTRSNATYEKLTFVAIWAISAPGTAYPQSAIDQLQPLVEKSARRLVIAEQVALAKWDSGGPVEDTLREAKVIADAVKDGESRDLNPISISDFFKAQIEANKIIQYSLLADWRRAGKALGHAPINLVGTIRPELDQLQTALIAELADTAAIRAASTCRSDVAKAVGKYMSAHRGETGFLQRVALDRALAASCTL